MVHELAKRALTTIFVWQFLVELIAFAIISILFLFYANRAFAWVISKFLRSITWHVFGVYIHIQALQFSLLAGRLFFKGFRYHGKNETILISDGQITWQYWIRHCRELGLRSTPLETPETPADDSDSGDDVSQRPQEAESDAKPRDLPCRILLDLRGVEWYVYNRSPAYDGVEEALRKAASGKSSGKANADAQGGSSNDSKRQSEKSDPAPRQYDPSGPSSDHGVNSRTTPAKPPLPSFLVLLPIAIRCQTVVMAMGNENTGSLLVGKAKAAHGMIDARAAGRRDVYRQAFDFHFEHVLIQMKRNEDFVASQISSAKSLQCKTKRPKSAKKHHTRSRKLQFRGRKHFFKRRLRRMLPKWQGSVESFGPELRSRDASPVPSDRVQKPETQTRWMGLSRYRDADENEKLERERWKLIEYASEQTILDSPGLGFTFFWDVPGPVTAADAALPDHTVPAPAYALELKVEGGQIVYGPWADRQRANLQTYFVPSPYTDNHAQAVPGPGQLRMLTALNISVIFDESAVLRIPTREPSKDWKWKGRLAEKADTSQNNKKKLSARNRKRDRAPPEIRPAGWLEIVVGRDTCISFSIGMVPTLRGYTNKLQVDLKAPCINTSVNNDVLLKSPSIILDCDLSNPLAWSSKHDWTFAIDAPDAELYFLRDHAFLLTDLVNDWTSSPASAFLAFVPFVYHARLDMPRTNLFLNVNDSNIIDQPTARDENAFIIIEANQLKSSITIPSLNFQPVQNRVQFDVEAQRVLLRLNAPTWNTQDAFLEHQGLACLTSLQIDGMYNYFSSTSPSLTDSLFLKVRGMNPVVHLHGFLVRYFMVLKNNYFGEDQHFQTLEEYQQAAAKRTRGQSANSEDRPRLSNDLDVILDIQARDGCVRVPSSLYSARENVNIDVPSAALDLRFTNYYMDLNATFAPLTVSRGLMDKTQAIWDSANSNTEIFVDGLLVYGHRLFGLPPSEPTYVCNWDFDVGSILGECSMELLRFILAAAQAFPFQFADAENALQHTLSPGLHDITILRARLKPIRTWILVTDAAFLLDVESVSLDFNDWAGLRLSECLSLSIPCLELACLETVAAGGRGQFRRKETKALLLTSVDVRMKERKGRFLTNRALQQAHVALHDTRTRRTPWFLDHPEESYASDHLQSKCYPPASNFPPMAEPVHSENENADAQNDASFAVVQKHRQQFISARSTALHYNALTGPVPDVGVVPVMTTPQSPSSSSSQSLHAPHRLRNPPVSFVGPYQAPHFRMQAVEPDLQNLPQFDHSEISFTPSAQAEGPSESFPAVDDEPTTLTNFFISFPLGVRAFATPDAMYSISAFVEELQLTRLPEILDALEKQLIHPIKTSANSSLDSRVMATHISIPIIAARCLLPPPNLQTAHFPMVYDLQVRQLQCIANHSRASVVAKSDPPESRLLATARSNRIRLSARKSLEGSLSEDEQARVEIDKMNAWAARDKSVLGSLEISHLQAVSPSNDIESLARFLGSSVTVATAVVDRFNQQKNHSMHRRRSLLYALASSTDDRPDPALLTKLSYVLRTAPCHPRNTDSWKIICRLRSDLQNMTEQDRQIMLRKATEAQDFDIGKLYQGVMAGLIHRYAWTPSSLENSPFMLKAFGRELAKVSASPALAARATAFDLTLRQFDLVMNPGCAENRLSLAKTMISVQQKPQLGSAPENGSGHLVLQIKTGHCFFGIDWELTALAEALLRNLQNAEKLKVAPSTDPSSSRQSAKATPVHLVMSIKSFKGSLQTPSLLISSQIQNVTTSAMIERHMPAYARSAVMLAAQSFRLQISSGKRDLILLALKRPLCNIDLLVDSTPERQLQKFAVGGFCDSLHLFLQGDLLSLIGVADRILADEGVRVQTIAGLVTQMSPKSARKPAQAVPQKTPKVVTIDLALLLQKYCLSFIVLSSLIYRIDGRSARSTASGSLNRAQSLQLDFDLQRHTHAFENHDSESVHRVAEITMPAINGSASLREDQQRRDVFVSLSLEQIMLEASALHAVSSTLSRSELLQLRDNIKKDLSIVRSNQRSLFRRKASAVQETDSKSLLFYTVRVAGAGVRIKASAAQTVRIPAQLRLDIGLYSGTMSNLGRAPDQPLVFPEILLQLKSLAILLQRSVHQEIIPCGDVRTAIEFHGTSTRDKDDRLLRSYQMKVDMFTVNMFTETASIVVDILGYLELRFKSFNLSDEINSFRARRRRAKSELLPQLLDHHKQAESMPTLLFHSEYGLNIASVSLKWRIGSTLTISPGHEVEDLEFAIQAVDLRTSKGNSARLVMQDIQLQMVPASAMPGRRPRNSALMPEILFNIAYISTEQDRRLAFMAVGKSVDLRLTPDFVLPAADLQRSIGTATQDLRKVVRKWNASVLKNEQQNKKLLGNKRLASVLVEADFAGAVVALRSSAASQELDQHLAGSNGAFSKATRLSLGPDMPNMTTLRTPGIAFKVEYQGAGKQDPSLTAEIRFDASSNMLQPSVVPLAMQLADNIRQIVGEEHSDPPAQRSQSPSKRADDTLRQVADPTAILGSCRLNVGLRICEQHFGLNCQPFAKIAAVAELNDIYVTINTVQTSESTRFFALAARVTGVQASVQHVYSREPTGRFSLPALNLSLMNSRHVSSDRGISAILRLSPMTLAINAKQLNDFLLFREVWLPMELRSTQKAVKPSVQDGHGFDIQRYQNMASAGGFPWNAMVAFEKLDVQVDLGQSLGKTTFTIANLWVASNKQSDTEQNLCVGFESIRLDATGRASCSLELRHLHLRTTIQWPDSNAEIKTTPLIQTSVGCADIRAKLAFEYQAFFVADISALSALMFNVREGKGDRLVCTVNGDKVQTFLTTGSPAQAYALYQAVQRFVQEKQAAFESSLRDLERTLQRPTAEQQGAITPLERRRTAKSERASVQLQTHVVISLKAIDVGVYPRTFFDNTLFKLEANDATASFAVFFRQGLVQSSLGLELGQVRIALSNVTRQLPARSFEDMSIDALVQNSTGLRSGTILRVPQLQTTMQTWQAVGSMHIEYVFKSLFAGRVEVGWNINRINFIRGMWDATQRMLSQRLGKSLPSSSRVQITGMPRPSSDQMTVEDASIADDISSPSSPTAPSMTAMGALTKATSAVAAAATATSPPTNLSSAANEATRSTKQDKITAVVNVPLSKYTYSAVEPPVIETPQLREMGEATPPLEWIGVQRDRLPHLTHQIVIVPLLEVAREVEDAYVRILGAAAAVVGEVAMDRSEDSMAE